MPEPKKILDDVQTYILDAQSIATAMKGEALLRGNMYAYVSAQASIDILLDMQKLKDGEKIMSIEEVKAEMQKAMKEQAEKVQGDTGVSDAQ